MKKTTICIVSVLLAVVFVIIGLPLLVFGNLKNKVEKNKEMAIYIESSLLGKTFSGHQREYSSRSGGSVSMMEFTDIKIECEFRQDGTACIRKTESFCNGFATVIDGNIVYNNSNTKEKVYNVERVEAKSTGTFEVLLENNGYQLVVEEDYTPAVIMINGITCELVN